MIDTRKFDLYGYGFKGSAFATYAAMRAVGPVVPHETIGGQNSAWFVTGYEKAEAILRDHERFVKDPSHARDPEQMQAKARASDTFQLINHHLLTIDPPDHTRLRALVNKAFTSRMVAGRRDRIQAVADALVDQVQDRGEMDVVNDYAYPFALTVIDDFLGIDAGSRDRRRVFADAWISPRYSGHDFNQIMEEFRDYVTEIVDQRRASPRNDLITRLIQVEEQGDKLSVRELIGLLALLLVAGFETTASFIGSSALTLLQHPDLLGQLRDDPSLMPAAVEELLRLEAPIERAPLRYAAEDVEIGGQQIRRGDIVLVVLLATNRDPARFGCPDEVHFDREDRRHLAFGQGIHFCVGAPLARLEGDIALSTLLRRLPSPRLNVPLEQLRWRITPIVLGLECLPVAWDVSGAG